MTTGNGNDRLLIRLLAGEANAMEQQEVAQWLNASEQNRIYFEAFERAWYLAAAAENVDALHTIDVNEKWERFAAKIHGSIAQSSAGDVAETVPLYNGETRRVVRMSWWRNVAVAAVIIAVAVVSLTWLMLPVKNKTVALNKTARALPAASTERHVINNDATEKLVLLPDGSEVWLAANSEISFSEPFIGKRNITLTGKAFFKVAKDKTKPFSVYSGPISTTALGTQFMVNVSKNKERVSVRLYEGSVVIKPTQSTNRRFKKDVYLVPGQEFVYGNPVMVRLFSEAANGMIKPARKATLAPESPSVPETIKGTWYMFNNQPLNQVFNQLSEMYHTPILFEQHQFGKIYFIGKYNSSDSLEMILKRIALLNNLVISKKENAFVITK